MIYDIHVHARLTDDPLPAAEDLMERGRRLGIEGMLVLGDVLHFGCDPKEEQIGQINDHTLQVVGCGQSSFTGCVS